MASHVGDTWLAMCVAHGKRCVIMHDPFETYKYGSSHSVLGGTKIQFVGAARRKRRKGKEKGRRGKEKGRNGNEKGRKRKEKER